MIEGLIISVVGMVTVFVTLTIIMFVMLAIERIFRDGEEALEGVGIESGVAVERVAGRGAEPGGTFEVATIAMALNSYLKKRGKVLHGQQITINDTSYQIEVSDRGQSGVAVAVDNDSYSGSVISERVVVEGMRPQGTADVAAIALAVAAYMSERGQEFTGSQIVINDIVHQVEVGDVTGPTIEMMVDGYGYRGSLGEEGLISAKQTEKGSDAVRGDAQRGLAWRSASSSVQGGYWDRKGWSGRGK